MFISGMGFFTDAYDLFVIGIVVSLLKPEWNLSTSQVSWLNSSTLLASAVGAVGPNTTDVHLSGRDLPDPGPHDRPRHIGRGRQAGRVPRRIPVP